METRSDESWMKYFLKIIFISAGLLSTHISNADASSNNATAVGANYLMKQNIRVDGNLAAAWQIHDRGGVHVLVLTRKAGVSPSTPRSERIDKIDLAAHFYTRDLSAQWQEEWMIRDGSDCTGLDVAGDFFTPEVSFTDLNNDGRIEVTVPYHLFCGGGVDPHVVKVILRDGQNKFAIRGESLVRYRGQKAFGGEHQHDKALLAPEHAAYKRHMDTVWRKVSYDSRD